MAEEAAAFTAGAAAGSTAAWVVAVILAGLAAMAGAISAGTAVGTLAVTMATGAGAMEASADVTAALMVAGHTGERQRAVLEARGDPLPPAGASATAHGDGVLLEGVAMAREVLPGTTPE
jgi:hypothetical protein